MPEQQASSLRCAKDPVVSLCVFLHLHRPWIVALHFASRLVSMLCMPTRAVCLDIDKTSRCNCVVAACARFEQTHNRPAVPANLTAVKQMIDKHIAPAKACKMQVPDAATAEFLCAERLPTVNAICGGVLAKELLEAVSHKGEPVNDLFFCSLSDSSGIVQRVG